ncbi:MAG TPA: DUF2169 domain-containing protein, partial [Byssovorax sp.]
MQLLSFCTFPVVGVAWQPQGDAWNLTLCAKATFDLVHGAEARVAAAQEPATGDAFYDANPHGALKVPSDYAPYKPRGDVLFVGSAHAPGGAPVDSLVATLEVGDFKKSIRVVGERAWVRGPSGVVAGPPGPFLEVPTRYERGAQRGDNLSGVSARGAVGEGGRALPNLEAIEASDEATPGFGPLPPAWRARRSQLAEAAIVWAYRMHARPATGERESIAGAPPSGFDFAFFNAAPRDQQVDVLRPALPIVLHHLHPTHARFETRLPNVRPRLFRMSPTAARPAEVAMRCDTVWIDGDRGVAVVSWRGMVNVAGPEASTFGRFVVMSETPSERVHMDSVRAAFEAGDAAAPSGGSAGTRALVVPKPPPPAGLGARPLGRVGLGLGVAPPPDAPLPPPAPPPQRAPSEPPVELADDAVEDDLTSDAALDPTEVDATTPALAGDDEPPHEPRARIETLPPPPDPDDAPEPAMDEDADTPSPSTPPPSALPFVASKSKAVLPFKPATDSGVAPRPAELPSKKLDGLPFKPAADASE